MPGSCWREHLGAEAAARFAVGKMAGAATAHEALSGESGGPDATALLADARRAVERASDRDAELAAFGEQLAEIGYRVTDLATEIAAYLADLDESGPHELAAVEDRRAVLGSLVRAHGSLEAAIDLLDTGSARLAELDDDGDRLDRLAAAVRRASATSTPCR